MQLSNAASPAQHRTDTMTIAQLAISGLGMAFSLLAAAALLFLGAVTLFSESAPLTNVRMLFSMAWIGLLAAMLAVPSILFSAQRLAGKEFFPRIARFPGSSLRASTLLLLIWPLVLLLGQLIATETGLSWLLLPPIQLLAAGIPTWWLVEIARRRLFRNSRQRGWGLVNFSVFITTPTLMFVEILVIIVLVIAFVLWVSAQPALLNSLESLAQNILNAQNNPEALMRLLLPMLQNPWVIVIALGITALLIPIIEEMIKPLGMLLLLGRRISPAEGFIAGALSGAGFALIETLFYLSNPTGESWALLAAGRSGTILLHITTTALVGWGLAAASSKGQYLRLFLMYLAAVTLHGMWNGLAILSGFSVFLENPPADLQLVAALARIAPFAVSVLAVGIFAILLWGNRHLQNQQRTTSLLQEAHVSSTTEADPRQS